MSACLCCDYRSWCWQRCVYKRTRQTHGETYVIGEDCIGTECNVTRCLAHRQAVRCLEPLPIFVHETYKCDRYLGKYKNKTSKSDKLSDGVRSCNSVHWECMPSGWLRSCNSVHWECMPHARERTGTRVAGNYTTHLEDFCTCFGDSAEAFLRRRIEQV